MVAKSHTRINVNDIIGKTFGGFKVISYSHKQVSEQKAGKRPGRLRSTHYYLVECLACKRTSIKRRGRIFEKAMVCKECSIENISFKNQIAAENNLYKDKPNKDNSNGIKHLHNGYKGKKDVTIMIDGKKYRLYSGYDSEAATNLANELNKVLKEKGKEGFFERYGYDEK